MPSVPLLLPDISFRHYQVTTLASFISSDPTLTPPNLFLHGASATGKTLTVNEVFKAVNRFDSNVVYALLQPIEFVTWKPLIQAISRVVQNTLRTCIDSGVPVLNPLRVEEPYHLVNHLNTCLEYLASKRCKPFAFYLILDGLDSLRDLDAQLIPKLLKLHELLTCNNLKIVYIIQDAQIVSRYASFAVPTIVFPRYTSEQILKILVTTRSPELSRDLQKQQQQQQFKLSPSESKNIVANFIQLILQAFNPYTGNDLNSLNDLIDLKWEPYKGYISKETLYDPVALYKRALPLFVATDDTFSADEPASASASSSSTTSSQTYILSPISKYLLIAAYFCSYIEPRYEASLFARKTHVLAGRRYYGRRKPSDKNPRHLQPAVFHIERLLAIFQAIFPGNTADVYSNNNSNNNNKGAAQYRNESFTLQSLIEETASLPRANAEVMQNLAELHALKLISTTVPKNVDFLSTKVKWKVNVPWEVVCEVADSVKFDIRGYFSGVSDE